MNGTSAKVIIPNYRLNHHKSAGVLYARPGVDSKIRFSIEPLPGEEAFGQWCDAMRAVARLPLGIPTEFRKKVWLSLADHHIQNMKIDWEQTQRLAFNDRSNPDDNRLGIQIVKDLHRTGCSGFSGSDNVEDRAILKRVLLAYARWNKKVGYCQGFNVLAALILDVVNMKEDDALKVMIYLVDHVLPESYFANNLRALSVDMAVFRDLLHIQLPQLSKRLDHLQAAAQDDTTGANYEPPLTNVFTMQWFLTLFATCLPKSTALRVWDSVLLEGSEILLRTAVAIWGKLKKRITVVRSADEFYTTMGTLTHEMLSCNIIDADDLIKMVYSMAPLPMPQLSDLREKYTYNITPFSVAMNQPRPAGFSDEDDIDEDELAENVNCFGNMFPPQPSPSLRGLGETEKSLSGSNFDISKASPGAYGAQPEIIGPLTSVYAERMSLDIVQLNQQYKKLKQRQNQAHIILAAASALYHGGKGSTHRDRPKPQAVVAPIQSPMAVNHLFIGRQQMANGKKNKMVAQAPNIVPFFQSTSVVSPQMRLSSKSDVRRCEASTSEANGTICSQDQKAKFSSSLSVNSSTSDSSTLKSSMISGSTSNVSTYGLDSDESDTESLVSRLTPSNDLIGWDETAKDPQANEEIMESCSKAEKADLSDTDEVEVNSSRDTVSSCEQEDNVAISEKQQVTTGQKEDNVVTGNAAGCVVNTVCDGEKSNELTSLSQFRSGKSDAKLAWEISLEQTNVNTSNRDDNNRNIQSNNISSDASHVTHSHSTGSISTSSHHAGGASSSHHTGGAPSSHPTGGAPSSHPTGGAPFSHPVSNASSSPYSKKTHGGDVLLHSPPDPRKGCKVQISTRAQSADDLGSFHPQSETHYVAALTYKSHKTLQPPIPSVTANQSSSQHCNNHHSNQRTTSGNSPVRSPRLFNPFPGQHVNSRRMQNGVKLGLYSANSMPKLETGLTQPPAASDLGRSRVNAFNQ